MDAASSTESEEDSSRESPLPYYLAPRREFERPRLWYPKPLSFLDIRERLRRLENEVVDLRQELNRTSRKD